MKHAIILGLVASAASMVAGAADDEWRFLVAPYVWFAGAEGKLTPAPGISPVDIDASAIDALRDTEASFMLLLQAQKEQHGVLVDVFYSDVLQQSETNSEYGAPYTASLENTMVTTGYTYEWYSSSQAIVNVVGGLRYWRVSTQLTLGQASQQQETLHNSESWVDPVVGLDAKFRPGASPVYLSGFFGVGGASGASDGFYDVSAHIGYALTDSIVASVGYRLFDVDYDHNSFVYDVRQEGWVIGLVWVLGTPRLSGQ
ncbi:MAG: hypothetical protein R2847_13255 [Bacteroidia bacterium]